MRTPILRWTRLLLVAGTATFVGCGSWPTGPGFAARTVVGTGNPALDVPAVQQAVDQGGTVLLKGRFDFGELGQVRLTRDVAVFGEADASGRPLTTIQGGFASLRSLPPETLTGPGPRIEIRRIRFDGAHWTPMQLLHTSGATVADNVVTRVKPAAFPPGPISGGRPYNMQHAVIIGGGSFEPGKPAPYRPGVATGPVKITGNDFDLATDVPRSTIAQAVFVIFTSGVQADIARNKIRNVARNSIEAIENFRGADGSGSIVIRDNDIETPAEGAPMPTPRAPNGIVVGYFLDPAAALDPKRAVEHRVTGNSVRAAGQTAAGSAAISLLADGATVADNRIVLAAPATVGMSISGSGNQVMRNRVEGSGALGIVVVPVPPLKGSNNVLADNDVTQLKAARAEIALMKGANQNRVSGSSGSVTDAGEGNVAVGVKRVTAAAN